MARLTLLFIAILMVTQVTSVHLSFAHFLYELEGMQWALRQHWFTETVMHTGVRHLNSVLVASLLLLFGRDCIRYGWTPRTQNRGLLILSVLTSFGLIAYLKTVTQLDCPWDLVEFGGTRPYYGLFQLKPSFIEAGKCFPAGHASIGFAWIALYFYWRERKPKRAMIALVTSLTVGFGLGFIQQLRGAHFFIDDITSAFIALWVATIFFNIVNRKPSEAKTYA
ncbi:phosphatase PAP2 family protein [Pseudidiomarina taiwanensis]|nr:phosphatase PAP2 family protein [Pseudidiomarina taiwanensis]